MTTKIKGICKGSFKYISQIFVEKEREMEIGYPTDVKHVAHIGWDGAAAGTAPSWMNEFKTGSDVVVASVGSSLGGSRDTTWTSQDFEQNFGRQSSSTMLNNFPPTNLPNVPKKSKRKKVISTTSSPKSSSARSSRSSKSKSKSISIMTESEDTGSRYSIKL